MTCSTAAAAALMAFFAAPSLACALHVEHGPIVLAQHSHTQHPSPASGTAPATAHVGGLTVTGAYVRAAAVPGGASAAYMTITAATTEDSLVAAETPAAARVELHTHLLDAAGVARMRQVEAIPIAPGAPAELKPGGLHVMLMGLTAPLVAGQTIPLRLVFERAGALDVVVPVAVAAPGHVHN